MPAYQCSVYDRSLRFSRLVYGLLIVVGYFTKNEWYVAVAVALLVLGAFHIKLNFLYVLHVFVSRDLLKKQFPVIKKEPAELSYVSGMTGALIFVGFLFVRFGWSPSFGWAWLLVMSLLLFMACFAGFCVATLSYALFLKLIGKSRQAA